MKAPLLVLCATDLSADADLAVVAANDIARLFGSRLVFVHAVPFPAPARVLFPHLVQGTTDRLMAVSRVAADTVAGRIASLTGRSEDMDVRVDVGAPDEVIVETAEESGADLLVIGVAGSDSNGQGLGDTAPCWSFAPARPRVRFWPRPIYPIQHKAPCPRPSFGPPGGESPWWRFMWSTIRP